jgi:predicted nucleic acid-binding Zn ribbon protein
MRCDKCGREFDWAEAAYDTYTPSLGRGSKGIKPLTMCPECGASRRGMLGFFVFVILLLILGLAAVRVLTNR